MIAVVVALFIFFLVCSSALYDVVSVEVLLPESSLNGVAVLSGGDAVSVGYVVNAHSDTPDSIIQRYTSSGKVVWTKILDGTTLDTLLHVRCDSADNIYVTGFSTNTWSNADGQTHAPDEDVLLLKLDSYGNELFRRQFGGRGDEQGQSICVDEKGGAVFVTGFTQPKVWVSESNTGKKSYIAKINATDGATLQYTEYEYPLERRGCAVDSHGDLWSLGYDSNNCVLQRHSDNGTVVTTIHDYEVGIVTSMTIDSKDNKYITGSGVYVAMFDASNTKVWRNIHAVETNDIGLDIAVDEASGRIYVSGHTSMPEYFGGGPKPDVYAFLLVISTTADGSPPSYVVRCNTDGVNSEAYSVATNGPYTYFVGATEGHGFMRVVSTKWSEV